jgi:hypothetical protein
MRFKPLAIAPDWQLSRMIQIQSEDHERLDMRNLQKIHALEAVAERDIDLILIE